MFFAFTIFMIALQSNFHYGLTRFRIICIIRCSLVDHVYLTNPFSGSSLFLFFFFVFVPPIWKQLTSKTMLIALNYGFATHHVTNSSYSKQIHVVIVHMYSNTACWLCVADKWGPAKSLFCGSAHKSELIVILASIILPTKQFKQQMGFIFCPKKLIDES